MWSCKYYLTYSACSFTEVHSQWIQSGVWQGPLTWAFVLQVGFGSSSKLCMSWQHWRFYHRLLQTPPAGNGIRNLARGCAPSPVAVREEKRWKGKLSFMFWSYQDASVFVSMKKGRIRTVCLLVYIRTFWIYPVTFFPSLLSWVTCPFK